MRHRDVRIREAFPGGDRLGHAERNEDPLLDQLFPRAATRFPRSFTSCEEHHVLIRVARSERRLWFEKANAMKHFLARDAGAKPRQLAATQSAAMGHRVANGELRVRDRIIHLERRQIVGDVIVVSHLAVAHQHGNERCGERLGAGTDLEERLLVDRRLFPYLEHAEALGVHNRVIAHDGHAEPRDLPGGDRFGDVVVEAGERIRRARRARRRDLTVRPVLRLGGNGDGECEARNAKRAGHCGHVFGILGLLLRSTAGSGKQMASE